MTARITAQEAHAVEAAAEKEINAAELGRAAEANAHLIEALNSNNMAHLAAHDAEKAKHEAELATAKEEYKEKLQVALEAKNAAQKTSRDVAQLEMEALNKAVVDFKAAASEMSIPALLTDRESKAAPAEIRPAKSYKSAFKKKATRGVYVNTRFHDMHILGWMRHRAAHQQALQSKIARVLGVQLDEMGPVSEIGGSVIATFFLTTNRGMHDVCIGIEAAGKALFRDTVLEGFEFDVIVKERAMSTAEMQQWKQIIDAMRAEEVEQPSLDLKGMETEEKVQADTGVGALAAFQRYLPRRCLAPSDNGRTDFHTQRSPQLSPEGNHAPTTSHERMRLIWGGSSPIMASAGQVASQSSPTTVGVHQSSPTTAGVGQSLPKISTADQSSPAIAGVDQSSPRDLTPGSRRSAWGRCRKAAQDRELRCRRPPSPRRRTVTAVEDPQDTGPMLSAPRFGPTRTVSPDTRDSADGIHMRSSYLRRYSSDSATRRRPELAHVSDVVPGSSTPEVQGGGQIE